MEVLVVEDDPRVARLVERALNEAGHRAETAPDGPDGLTRAQSGAFDVVVLDVMLPEMDGLTVCRTMRQQGVRTPVILLTARDAVPDRVRGLDAGADDYLVKPFALEELLARVRALGRRASDGHPEGTLQVGDLTLDLTTHEAHREGKMMALTAKEFALLRYLMRNTGRVLAKAQITDHVWGYDSDAASNVVEIYIHYLRDKVDRGFTRPLIRTVRAVGYVLKE